MSIRPIDLRQIDEQASNVYEAIIVCSKRSRQINEEQKLEFNQLLSTIPSTNSNSDDDGEDFVNPQQIKVSLEFEKRKKPHLRALDSLLAGEIKFEIKAKN
ncbi:MAG: DNA-directed RNA polymerase subunit omega [Chlorobiaceae bacterium]|mgnify:CR=1 FL=1|nr:DNA-directed RNA polymerase subunit omega [Chlorobiaceae bacterium]MBA4310622.1 DNA-directed RNA polymerase subunit omega [Chlorobiaceae bacterium]